MTTVNVRYMVDDVDAAVAFYTTHFGFEVLSHFGDAFADVAKDDLRLQVLAIFLQHSLTQDIGIKLAGFCKLDLIPRTREDRLEHVAHNFFVVTYKDRALLSHRC